VLNAYDRTPVVHARVTFSAEGAESAPVETGVSDGGAFRVRLPRAGVYAVRAAAEGFWDYRNPGFSVLTRRHSEIRILMEPRLVLTGCVVDTRDRPVADALVRFTRGDPGPSGFTGPDTGTFRGAATTSDASGYFEKELPPGEWMVGASHVEFESLGSVTVAFPEEDDVTLRMRPPSEARFGRVAGLVLDSEGSPVSEAVVHLGGLDATGAGSARSDSAGRFAFERVRPGRYRLLPSAPGYIPAMEQSPELRVEADGDYFVELTLLEGGPLEGVVLNPAGRGVDQARVILLRDGDLGTAMGAFTDSEGRFLFKIVPSGRYEVEAFHRDYRTHRGELEVSRETKPLTLILEDGLTFQGTLSTLHGMPVERFTLFFFDAADPNPRRSLKSADFTAIDGRFLVKGLDPGAYRLEVATGDERGGGTVLELRESVRAVLILDPSNEDSSLRVVSIGP
jgi:hypothetical protein